MDFQEIDRAAAKMADLFAQAGAIADYRTDAEKEAIARKIRKAKAELAKAIKRSKLEA